MPATMATRSPGSLSALPAASANTTKGWDSLSFLNLILEVEATFQRRLTPAGIMGINQLGDVVRLLESKQST